MYDDTVTIDKTYYNKLKEQNTWISVDISMYFVKYIKGFKVVVELDSNLDKD